ncbi:MAG: LamG-like jellyroll fold domain-containing protein [Phycisphaerae bacterium]
MRTNPNPVKSFITACSLALLLVAGGAALAAEPAAGMVQDALKAAEAKVEAKDFKGAREEYQKALATRIDLVFQGKYLDWGELAYMSAYTFRLENDLEHAKAEFVKLLDRGEPREKAKLHFALYDICQSLKDSEGAREQLASIGKLEDPSHHRIDYQMNAAFLATLPLTSRDAAAEGAKVKRQLLDLSGGRRVKVVWLHDYIRGVFIFDTAEEGARKLPIDGIYPQLTPDGTRVLATYNQAPRQLVMCDSDGRNETVLSRGPYSFLLSVWRDPKTGRDWAYVNDMFADVNQKGATKIFRFPIDKPEARELVWDRTTSESYFTLSADGTRACFSPQYQDIGQLTLVHNAAGGIDQDKSVYTPLGVGCYPGIASDNSYRIYHNTGSHQAIHMFDADGTNFRSIPINEQPGMNDQRIQLMRWSTDPRFLTLMGPESNPKADLWIGRFDEKFTKFEAWVKVHAGVNGHPVSRSHAWVEPDKATSGTAKSATPAATTAPAAPASATAVRWAPAEGAVFAIRNAHVSSKALAYEANGRELLVLNVRERGRALHGRHFEWLCDDGSFLATQGGEWLSAQVRKAGAVSIEATLEPRSLGGGKRAVAWSFGTDKETVAAIAQLEKRWVLQLKGGEEIGLFARDTEAPFHLVLTIGNGFWQAYVDGKAAANGKVKGNASDWSAGKVALGALPSAEGTWRGRIHGVAVYARVLTPHDAAKQAEAMKAELDARQPIKPLKFNGTLVRQARTSELKDILPYTRSLTMAEYQVDNVLAGEWKHPTILVLHWAILNSVRLPLAERKPGGKVELTVEPLEGHPQLEPHRRDELPDANPGAAVFYCESEPTP